MNNSEHKFFLIFLFIAGSVLLAISSQAADDHLRPVNSLLGTFDHSVDYQVALRKWLIGEKIGYPLARLVVAPSFSPEYSVTIHAPHNESPYVEYRKSKQLIWASPNRPNRKIDIYKKDIRPDIAYLVSVIWFQELMKVKQPESSAIGLDGVSYYFSKFHSDTGILEGTAWSPHKSTKITKLIEIAHHLINYCLNDRPKSEEALENLSVLGNKLLNSENGSKK